MKRDADRERERRLKDLPKETATGEKGKGEVGKRAAPAVRPGFIRAGGRRAESGGNG
jgi:hypothetical protein